MQSSRCHTKQGERGLVLVLVLVFIMIVSGLSFGMLYEGMAAQTSLRNHESNLRALEVAEIGLVRAEAEIRSQVDHDANGIGNVTGDIASGTFDVSVQNDPVSPDRWVLTASAVHRMSERRVQVAVRRRIGSAFADALFSMEDLPVSNVSTDAYRSSLGPYAPQAIYSDANGTYAESGGSLGSNADVHLDGTAVWVRGNAIPGPLRDVFESGGPTVTGDMVPRRVAVPMDATPYADFLAAFNSNNNGSWLGNWNGNAVKYNQATYVLDVAGNTHVQFPAGTYFFKDLKVNGGSSLTMLGPVKIYVTGTIDIGAGTHIIGTRPSDVRIYTHPYDLPSNNTATETLVKVNGGSEVTWALYGPEARLDIGGGNSFYGAAVGKVVELQGSNAFHYDKDLGAGDATDVATLERLYWRDVSPPRR